MVLTLALAAVLVLGSQVVFPHASFAMRAERADR